MIKHAQELASVALLATANLTMSGLKETLGDLEPIMHFLVSLGQFSVAVVTVWYIARKIHKLRHAIKLGDDE